MMPTTARWENRMAKLTGETTQQLLQRLLAENGGKKYMVAMTLGMSHHAITNAYKRNRVAVVGNKLVTFRGVTGSLTSHCKIHSLSYYAVRRYCQYYKIPAHVALERYVTGQVKNQYQGASQ